LVDALFPIEQSLYTNLLTLRISLSGKINLICTMKINY
jgi:hypothetical protein